MDSERGVYLQNLEDWRRTHLGEFVLIKGSDVVGFFSSLEEAFDRGTFLHGLEPFFIQRIAPQETVNVSFHGARVLSA
ncbi:MAG: hypothetical protein HY049_06710 [Acidobacteria bacterium]|nr:hypothetical protein [Acidobacteriota bacterium]